MPMYSMEFRMRNWKGVSFRDYCGDAYVRSAAMKIFANRTSDANDEIYVYEGDYACNHDVRCVGKVAFLADGETVGWFKPNHS